MAAFIAGQSEHHEHSMWCGDPTAWTIYRMFDEKTLSLTKYIVSILIRSLKRLLNWFTVNYTWSVKIGFVDVFYNNNNWIVYMCMY